MSKMNNIGVESTKTNPVYLKKLMDKLDPHLQYHNIGTNTRFTYASNRNAKCFFLKSGLMSVYRQPDDILVELFDAPTLRGAMILPPGTDSSYTFKVLAPSEIAIVDRDVFFEMLSKHRLWELFAMHQLMISSLAIERIFKLTKPTSYDIIRHQLYELINLSDELRESIVVADYIRGKTRMSRSGVLRILSDLKSGGFIVIEKGILKEVRSLPNKY